MKQLSKKDKILEFVLKNIMFFAVLILCIVLATQSSVFLTVNNWFNIIIQISTPGIIAIGMTFVIITGGIDLSVGSSLAYSAIIGSIMMKQDIAIPICIITMLAIGLAFGTIQGLIISRMKMPPFIVTLAGMAMGRGLSYVATEARTIPSLPSEYSDYIGGLEIFGLPFLIILFVAIAAIGHYVLRYTTFGRKVYAFGGNSEAARLSGINVNTVQTKVYAISGLLAAVSGIVLTSRLGAGPPNAGEGIEMDAIAAVVIGGASLSGGSGSIPGTVLGMVIIGIISNSINILNINPFYQEVVKGAVILLAVTIDTLKHRRDHSK